MDGLRQDEAAHSERADGRSSRISRIELWIFSYPMVGVGPGGVDVTGARSERTRLAVRIETRDGAQGSYVGGQANALSQATACARSVLGLDAFAREQAYERIRRQLRKEDRMGAGVIDIAMWDLAGKRMGLSVSQMLGGTKTRLPAYASTWFGGEGGGLSTPEAFVDFAEECHGLGYRGFKMHGWTDGSPVRDAEAVRLLGRKVGDRMALMHDAACHLRNFADALEVGRACDDANFFWYEDPYSDGGLAAHSHRRLREMLRTPILLGEHVRGLESMATLTLADGTDFVRADPDFDIGITGTMKIAHFAEALGLDCELHAPGPAHRHCMAAMRNTNFYELSMVGPSRGNFNAPVYTCGYSDALDDIGEDGCVPVPEGPGLGVSYDWDYIARNAKSHVVVE
ncbi:enolase C-terminal domain-like protein [Bosea sp. BK604]|uniref:enolase C-terminal domain-like protein n=1 Tax=Bosea sp. BK604 TaxID=2512180 RepID=UPI0010461634|nr:enolase C-terminal domain-like protein [Bosea sp. BK604]TCR63086.1 L-alanine-DL-glutamate epimerase-like enolase superfamily enzyme [Bosea sp. BK604]